MKRHKPKPRIETRSCDGCRWYASFEGVCCNAESDYCADWPPYRCELYDAAESAEGAERGMN